MTIHSTHPFLDPEGDRDPVRRLRGRLGGTVSLWTAGTADGRAGLTVSSWMVAGGEPGRVLALLDPDADLTETLLETRRGVLQLLTWEDRGLADVFAGLAPHSRVIPVAEELTTGRFRIRSRAQARVQSNATHTQVRRARAVLEINGTKHPLMAPGLVIGRGTEADIRINDPGVSRQHVEFVVNGDDLEVVDLGSTNGMLVNGTKVPRAALRDGTEVKIGRTTMTVRLDGHADGEA